LSAASICGKAGVGSNGTAMRRLSCAATRIEKPERPMRKIKLKTPVKLLVRNIDGLLSMTGTMQFNE
jgi:hypothetical protein